MTRIEFHFNAPERLQYACRLLRKASAQRLRMGVVGDAARTSTLVVDQPFMGLLAPETRAGKLFSDVWLYLFNQDFRIDPKDLWRQTWCTDAPWPPD